MKAEESFCPNVVPYLVLFKKRGLFMFVVLLIFYLRDRSHRSPSNNICEKIVKIISPSLIGMEI